MKEDLDLGIWVTPTSWSDITIEQLINLQSLKGEEPPSMTEIIAALTNHTVEEVEALPISFSEKILGEMSFLQEPMPEVQPSNKVVINGEEYIVHNEKELRTGEFVAAQMAVKDEGNGFPLLLAILARKEGEEYNSDFENKVLPQRVEMFKKARAMDVLPLTTFFLSLWMVSEWLSQSFGEVREALENLTQQLTESSSKGGVGRLLYTKWLTRKLNKLKRSVDGL